MTARDEIEIESNVVSLSKYRHSVTPKVLDQAGVAEFLQDEFDIDVSSLADEGISPHSELAESASEVDGTSNTDRIMGMATVVIDLGIDVSEVDEEPEPEVQSSSPWVEDIKIFLGALQKQAEQELATGCHSRARGIVVPLFAANEKIKKDV